MANGLQFTINPNMTDRLREDQALLGATTLKETANFLVSLGHEVLRAAAQGGQVAIIDEDNEAYHEVKHPALDNLKRILSEKD